MMRDDFKDDFALSEDVAYLDAANIGLVPETVIETATEIFADIARGGTRELNEQREAMVYDSLREESAALFGCTPDDVAIFGSTTEALNVIAWSLDLGNGTIISTDVEFPSVTYPWMRIARTQDLDVVLVESENWIVPEETLLTRITADTEVVVLSHVEYLTGQRFDLQRIIEHAHEMGAIVVVDGIQAAGFLPLDLQKMGVDVYITGSYKWLLAPFGAAVAYIDEDLRTDLDPAFVGWRSVEEMWDLDATTLTYAPSARKFEYSTSAYDVKLAMAESIKYLRSIGIENIYDHNRELVTKLRQEVRNIDGTEIISPGTEGSRLTFTVDDMEGAEIERRLQNLSRPIEVSIRSGLIRVSPHIYNTEADIQYAVEQFKEILEGR